MEKRQEQDQNEKILFAHLATFADNRHKNWPTGSTSDAVRRDKTRLELSLVSSRSD